MKKQGILTTSLMLIVLLASACTGSAGEEPGAETQPPTETVMSAAPTAQPEPTENPFGDWLEYQNQTIDFRFLYPQDWFGPEVYETEGSLRIEVGSDQVYPYGTNREDQTASVPDAYFILIQYFENTSGRTWNDFISSGWIDTYLALQEMEDGQFTSTPRSVATRIGEVNLGEFSGLMYLATIPDNAQTERAYIREAMLFDEELNWLRVSATPSLVQIADPENWKNDYARVDQIHLETFLKLLNSITIQ